MQVHVPKQAINLSTSHLNLLVPPKASLYDSIFLLTTINLANINQCNTFFLVIYYICIVDYIHLKLYNKK